MFYTSSTEGYEEALPGVKIKTLVYGEKTLLAELRLNKGSSLPAHSHPHEQTGYMIEGKCSGQLIPDSSLGFSSDTAGAKCVIHRDRFNLCSSNLACN